MNKEEIEALSKPISNEEFVERVQKIIASGGADLLTVNYIDLAFGKEKK
jgi:hypothetical protein